MNARPENDEYSREAHFVSDDWPTGATSARTARSSRQSRQLYFLHYARYVSLCINVVEAYESPVTFVDVKLSFQGNSDIQTSSSSTEFTFSILTPFLQGEDNRLFIEFASRMLRWLPEERSTAKELYNDPWLNFDSK